MDSNRVPPGAAAGPARGAQRPAGGLYATLQVCAALLALIGLPFVLADLGVIAASRGEAMAEGCAMMLAPFALLALAAAFVLSLPRLVRGPTGVRAHVLAWWGTGLGGGAVAKALAPVDGTAQGGAPQASTAVLAVTLLLLLALPGVWRGREAEAARPAAEDGAP